MTERLDNPGVIAPPPLLYLGTLAVGVATRYLPVVPRLGLGLTARALIGIALVGVGFAIGKAGEAAFRRAGTRPEPWKPSTTVVARGIYARTRNPMYVGMTLAYIGLGTAFDSLAALILLAPLLIVVRRGVVAREERYMAAKFGSTYLDYTARVPRWL